MNEWKDGSRTVVCLNRWMDLYSNEWADGRMAIAALELKIKRAAGTSPCSARRESIGLKN